MGRISKFTSEQDVHIATYFAELEEIYEQPGLAGWKDRTANDIVNSELFKGKLPSVEEDEQRGGSPTEWLQRVKDKFKNQVTAFKKKATGGATTSTTRVNATPDAVALHPATSAKSFFNQDVLTAQKLFEHEQKSAINAAAGARAQVDGVRLIERFHSCKKEMWEALSDAQREDYKRRADSLQNDVEISQAGFSSAIYDDMSAFVASGRFGQITMSLFYSYRDPAQRLFVGCSSVATIKNGSHFHEGPNGKAVLEMWQKHSEGALPSSLERIKKNAVVPDIPLNAEGIPVFPRMDLMETPPAGVLSVLQEFLRQLWAHCRPMDTSFTWARAAAYYDKTRFVLPVPLETLGALTGLGAIICCAEFFMALEGADVFVFAAGGGLDLDGQEAEETGTSGEDGAAPKNKGKSKKTNAKGDGLDLDGDADGMDGEEEGAPNEEDAGPLKNQRKAKAKALAKTKAKENKGAQGGADPSGEGAGSSAGDVTVPLNSGKEAGDNAVAPKGAAPDAGKKAGEGADPIVNKPGGKAKGQTAPAKSGTSKKRKLKEGNEDERETKKVQHEGHG
ncbi:hypothetical protein C8R44DRAFT_750326 [Mycena epipterygia]|nr:hypothetical protein C8R44DRAFT_750326 [Mycena epipterygia]